MLPPPCFKIFEYVECSIIIDDFEKKRVCEAKSISIDMPHTDLFLPPNGARPER